MRMIKEATHQRPRFPRVPRFKERSRFHTAVQHIWLVARAKLDLPDILQRHARIRGESHRGLLRIGPAFPEVVAGSQHRAPIIGGRGPDAALSGASVELERVHRVPVKIRASKFPSSALRIRTK